MTDIKLFKIGAGGAEELVGKSAKLERTLQKLIEENLESLLGVRFLETEYSTGKAHGGRMDTIGIDENGLPVIIEYKRHSNENVINQGLFYLDWLMDHKGDFELLVQKKFNSKAAENIDWSGPRLICIAGDFTRYDEHAVKQMGRNIELIRYRHYGDDLLLFEQINTGSMTISTTKTNDGQSGSGNKEVTQYIAEAPPEILALYEAVKDQLESLGDDVQVRTLKRYIAFKRIKNFACVEVHPKSATILVFLKVDPDSITLENGFTRDVRTIGHFGTGDLEIRIKSSDDINRISHLFSQSYERS